MRPRIAALFALLLAGPANAQPGPAPRTDDPSAVRSAARLDQVEAVRKTLGLSPAYDPVKNLADVKIAVLDYGFDGVDGKRPYLPADTVVVEHYDADFVRRHDLGDPNYTKGFEAGNAHGRMMAQIVWGTTGAKPDGPKFYLLNANGPTMFRRAVRYAIEAKVDVILFAAVFEGAGNYDGNGPYAAVVDAAVDAGIVWVNAAGNFGGRVVNAPVRVRRDGFLDLGKDGTGVAFRNRLDENTVTVTLTWNDYRAQEDAGTTKDLDLVVEDADGNVLGRGELKQIEAEADAGEGKSLNPRERVVLTALGASEKPYRIRVLHKGGTFADTDRLRLLVTASRTTPVPDPKGQGTLPPVELVGATRSREIFPPADHPRVVTVGDATLESSIGPTADGRLKPDVLIPDSRAAFTNGDGSTGSSNAAAYFAAVAVTLKAAKPDLRGEHLIRYAAGLRAANKPALKTGRDPVQTPPAGLRDVSRKALDDYGYGPIVEKVQRAVGGLPQETPVRLWLNAEGRVVLGIARKPADLTGLFPNHPFPRHPQLSEEYECYLSIQPAPGGGTRIMDSFRLKPDAPHRTASMALPRMAPQLVEVRQVPAEPVNAEERTRDSLLDRAWQTPAPAGLATLLRASR